MSSNTGKVEFKFIDASDAEELLKLENQIFRSGKIGSAWGLDFFFPEHSRAQVLAAHSTGELLGYIQWERAVDEGLAFIGKLAVRGKYRRQGLGRRLFGHALQFMTKDKIQAVELEVAADNKPAVGFYTQMGFNVIRTRKNYYQGGGDALVMRYS